MEKRAIRVWSLVAGIVLVLLVAAAVLPRLISFEPERGRLTDEVSAALGRPARIAGPIRLALLPVPALTAQDVTLLATQSGAPAHVRQLALRLDVLALLGFHQRFSSAVLEDVDLALTTSELAAWRTPTGVPTLRVRHGTITLLRPGLPPLTLSDVDAELTPDAAGSALWRANGGLRGVGWELRGGLAAPDKSGQRFLTATLNSVAASAQLAGKMDTAAGFVGHLDVRGGPLIGQYGGSTPGLVADVSVAGGRMDLTNLTLAVPGAKLAGRGAIGLAGPLSADFTLATPKLDLDRWLAVLKPAAGLGLPKELALNLDLTAREAAWRGASLTDAHLSLSLDQGDLTLNEAQAALPGGAQIAFFGQVAPGPAFDGTLRFDAADPSKALAWITGEAALPGLPTTRVEGHLRWQAGAASFDQGTIRLGSDTLNADLAWKDGPRPTLGVSVSGPRLDLDALRPALAALPLGGLTRSDIKLGAQLGSLSVGGVAAQNMMAALSWSADGLVIDNLVVGDLAGSRLHVAGRLPTPTATLPATQPGAGRGVSFELASPQPGRLVALTGSPPPSWIAALGAIEMSGRLDAAALAPLAFDLADVRLRAGRIVGAGNATLTLGDKPRLEAALSFPETNVEALLGPAPAPPRPVEPEPAAKPGRAPPHTLVHRPPAVSRSPLAAPPAPTPVPRPEVSVQALGTVPPKPQQPQQPQLPPFLARLAVTLHLDANGLTWNGVRLDNPAATLAGADATGTKAWTVTNIAAGLFGGRLAGQGTLGADGAATLALTLTGAKLDATPVHVETLQLAGGALDVKANLTVAPGPAAAWPARLAGSGSFQVGPATLRGLDLGAAAKKLGEGGRNLLPAISAALGRNATRIASLTGTVTARNGVLACTDLKLAATEASVAGALSVDVPARRLTLESTIAFPGTMPALAFKVAGPWSKPGASLTFASVKSP